MLVTRPISWCPTLDHNASALDNKIEMLLCHNDVINRVTTNDEIEMLLCYKDVINKVVIEALQIESLLMTK